MESHWKILSRRGIWLTQLFLPAYLYQEARKNESSYSKLPAQWKITLGRGSDQWSIRRNLTGKASGKGFDSVMNMFPWLALRFPSLPSLNSGMMSRMVQASCNHEGKARTIRITPAITSRTAAPKPAASLDFLVWENRNPCCFHFFHSCYFFFCHTTKHAGSKIPNQGSNASSLGLEARSVNHWASRAVHRNPRLLITHLMLGSVKSEWLPD